MERRSFLKFLLSTPLAAVIDYEQLLWVKEKTIFIPPVRPVELYENFVLETPLSLYGVPYHQSNASTDRWLGFERDANYSYERIGLDKAIKDGHVRKHEIESITKFVKRLSDNA